MLFINAKIIDGYCRLLSGVGVVSRIIHLVTPVPCDSQQAFEMFTSNELLEIWLTTEANIEPQIGGKFELFWNPQDKNHDSTIGCVITAIEPGKFLAFNWKGPRQFEQFMNTVDPLTHVVVFFLPCPEAPDHCTEVHLVHSGWGSSDRWEEARVWFEKSWENALVKFREYIRGEEPPSNG